MFTSRPPPPSPCSGRPRHSLSFKLQFVSTNGCECVSVCLTSLVSSLSTFHIRLRCLWWRAHFVEINFLIMTFLVKFGKVEHIFSLSLALFSSFCARIIKNIFAFFEKWPTICAGVCLVHYAYKSLIWPTNSLPNL